jgi:menaquinone-dependent protoporphyrinogen IX oxidase
MEAGTSMVPAVSAGGRVDSMGKVLVAFYSSAGTTRKAGQAVAAALGADVEDIQEVNPRHLDIRGPGGLRKLGRIILAGGEVGMGRSAPILPSKYNPAEYDLVVIGTPVWNARLTGPVRAYIQRHKHQFKSVAFFRTGLNPRPSLRCFQQMEQACGQAPKATANFDADKVKAGDFAAQVQEFMSKLA